MMRTLEEWIEIYRPDGWQDGLSWPFAGRYGDIREMIYAWDNGALTFGKYPVVRSTLNSEGEYEGETKKVGPVRPLRDPEPAPEGAEFFLAWHDGIRWCDRFDLRYIDPHCHGLFGRVALDRVAANAGKRWKESCAMADQSSLEQFREAVEKGDDDRFEPFGSSIDRLPRVISEGNTELAMAIAYAAGKSAGRAETLREIRGLLERDKKRTRTTDLVEIVVCALERHGEDLTPVALLEKMQGVRNRVDSTWTFPNGETIDQADFSAAYKAAEKRRSRGKDLT